MKVFFCWKFFFLISIFRRSRKENTKQFPVTVLLFGKKLIKITPWVFQNVLAINFLAEETVFAFFGTRSLTATHYFWCIHVLSIVIKGRKHSTEFLWYSLKFCLEVFALLRLWRIISRYGTNFTTNFLISKYFFKIWCIHSDEIQNSFKNFQYLQT